MSFSDQFKRIQRIDNLIRVKATGSASEFAKKMNLSRSGLLKILKEMKELGFPIKFDFTKNSYYYEFEGKATKVLFISSNEILSKDDMAKIKGGRYDNAVQYYLSESTNSGLVNKIFTEQNIVYNKKIEKMKQKKIIGTQLTREEMKKIMGGYVKYTCWGTCLDGSSEWYTTNSPTGGSPGCAHHGGPAQGGVTCWENPLPQA